MDSNKTGKFIAKIRKEKNLTQQELGDKLFVTDKAVSKWERGLSFPDISILERLAEELNVEIVDILAGKKGTTKKVNVEEEIEKVINNIKKEQERKKKRIIKCSIIGVIILLIIVFIMFFGISSYKKYHPSIIKIGDNNYKINNYSLQNKGLIELQNIVKKSRYSTNNYNVSYLEIKLSKGGKLEEFTLSINFFDHNKNYEGCGGYIFKNDVLTYNYTNKADEKNLLVETYSKNNNINYISDQIKKIPLKEQIKVSELNNYFITYMPNTTLEWGTPIFDGQDNKKISVLSKKDYNKGLAGESKNDMYFAIRLNDGSSIATGQQYLYVFDYIDDTAPKNPNYMMETDYYINNGKLQFTRDYGKSWINTDITKEQLQDTLKFYGDISLRTNSWYLSTNELIPIAYFYGDEPTLKISNDNGKTWYEYNFITSEETFNKPITKRIVGFTSQNFGYVALGTDWTMGSGEIKKLYFTYDGGKTWDEVNIPLNGTSHILYDFCMYDENVGVLLLRDSMDSNFPIIYSTISGGKAWSEVKYRNSNLPDEIDYINEVDSITKEGENYFIKLGQGSSGTLKASFRTGDMIGWLFIKTTYENIHTVG